MTKIPQKSQSNQRTYTTGRIKYPAQQAKKSGSKSDTGTRLNEQGARESGSDSSPQSTMLNIYLEPSQASSNTTSPDGSRTSSLLLKSLSQSDTSAENSSGKASKSRRKPPPDLEISQLNSGPQRRISKNMGHSPVAARPLSAEIFSTYDNDSASVALHTDAIASKVSLPLLPQTADVSRTSTLRSSGTVATQQSSGLADLDADAKKFIDDFKNNVKQAQIQTRTARKTVPWMTRIGSVASGLLVFTGHLPVAIAMAITFPVAGALVAKIQQRLLLKKDNVQAFMAQMQDIEQSPYFDQIKKTPEYKKAQEINKFLGSKYGISILMTGLHRAYAPIFAGIVAGVQSVRTQNNNKKALENKLKQVESEEKALSNSTNRVPETDSDNELPLLTAVFEDQPSAPNTAKASRSR